MVQFGIYRNLTGQATVFRSIPDFGKGVFFLNTYFFGNAAFDDLYMTSATPCPTLTVAPIFDIFIEEQLHQAMVFVSLESGIAFFAELVKISKAVGFNGHRKMFWKRFFCRGSK